MRGIESVEFPKIIKKHAVDLIKQLCSPGLWTPFLRNHTFFDLQTDDNTFHSEPETRLGSELGVIELKHHKWLRDFDFDGLYRSQLTSPIKVISICISCQNYSKWRNVRRPGPQISGTFVRSTSNLNSSNCSWEK